MQKSYAIPGWFSAAPVAKIRRAGKSKTTSVFWFLGSVGLIALIAVLLMNYMLGVNNYTSRGYEIRTLQTNLNQLSDQNKKLNLQMAEVTSILSIQAASQNSNYVSAGAPQFLQTNQYTQR